MIGLARIGARLGASLLRSGASAPLWCSAKMLDWASALEAWARAARASPGG